MRSFCLLVVLGLCAADVLGQQQSSGNYEAIVSFLWKNNYGKLYPLPPKKPGDPRSGWRAINVTSEVNLKVLSAYDPMAGTIRVNYWHRLKWRLPSLSWDPSKFDGVKTIRVPSNTVWLPDIMIFTHVTTERTIEVNVVISYDGTVMWVQPMATTIPCRNADIANQYPREEKVCSMKIGSWTYDGFLVNFTLIKGSLGPTALLDSSPLESSGWKMETVNEKYSKNFYACCPEPYPDISLNITIRRADDAVKFFYRTIASTSTAVARAVVALMYLLPPSSSARIVTQSLCLLIFIFTALIDTSIMRPAMVIGPEVGYIAATMMMNLLAIAWSVFMAVVWASCSRQSSNSSSCSIGCCCLLPTITEGVDGLEADANKASRQRRHGCIPWALRVCLVLDRLLFLLNFIVFTAVFFVLGV